MCGVFCGSRETGALELMDTLKGRRRGYSSFYLKRKVDEEHDRAIEKAAREIEWLHENGECGMSCEGFAKAIRALKGTV